MKNSSILTLSKRKAGFNSLHLKLFLPFELSPYPLLYEGKLVRWGLLGFSCTPLLATYFYHQGYRVGFLVCPIQHLTGIPCPTCGMTRSFMAISQGNLVAALAENLSTLPWVNFFLE